jgi:2-amino-4-hydroxy-6-hydroxymethyldihydropteridine diphosphokinase
VSEAPVQALVALGSNLGDRATTLGRALSALGVLPGTRLLAASPAYDSDPVGLTDQPAFLNLVAAVETRQSPRELLTACLEIEGMLGRVRAERNGPRTCDLDLLFHGKVRMEEPGLTLPHPRWSERGFVVFPLRDLLQMAPLAAETQWDWLRAETARTKVTRDGLRPWTGSTPWKTTAT